jgi:hypothetical protein
MNGPAEGPGAADDHDGPGGGARHRSTWLGLLIGVVAVSGALIAVVHDRGGDAGDAGRAGDADRAAARSGPVATSHARTEWTHEWSAAYSGPVWITVDAGDAGVRTVVIRWGPWQRRIVHETADPVTYVFKKDPTRAGDRLVPTTIHVEPGAEVAFGQGATPPTNSIDVNDGWTAAPDDPG